MERRQAELFLSNFSFGLGGLDDVMQNGDGEMLGCASCGSGGLGFIGQSLTSSALQDAQKVVAAAATPGTEATKVVAGRLARKGLELGKVAHDRAQVARKAREKRDELVKKVEKLQPKVDRLLVSDNPKDQQVGEALKQDQYSAARAAVRLEKVNTVASGLAENAAAQAVLAQQIAGTVIAGKPALTATLSSMYNKLGQSSASMQKTRQQQIINSAKVLDQDKVRALLAEKRLLLQQRVDLEVLLTCDPPNAANLRQQLKILFGKIQAINNEVRKLCATPRPTSQDKLEKPNTGEALEGLQAAFDIKAVMAAKQAREAALDKEPIIGPRFENAKQKGWIKLTPGSSNIRVTAYTGKLGQALDPSIDPTQVFGNIDLRVAQAARGTFKPNPKFPGGKQFVPDARPLLKGQLGIVEQRLGRKLTELEKQLLRHPAQYSTEEIGKVTQARIQEEKKAFRRGIEKSGSAFRIPVVGDVLNTAKAVGKPVVSIAKTAVNTAILPATTAAKLVTKGPEAALKNISRTMKKSIDDVRKAAGQLFVGLPCQLANSSVGKAAMQVGAAAVGTAVGGPAGTVAGAVAANRSQALTKSVCGGLDKIGLTKGDFRTSKLGAALKQTAMGIGRNLTDPKALLKDAQSIGTAVVPGVSNATQLLNKFGGSQLQKLGLDQVARNVNLPGGAQNLLRSVGLPSNAADVLKAAGLPANPVSVLKAAGLPSNVTSVLKQAGLPTDLPSMVKGTQILKGMNLPVTPANLAKAMNVRPIPVPGLPGKFRLPSALPRGVTPAQARQSAARRIALVRQAQRRVAGRPLPKVAFPTGSPARALLPYVRR
jgi:hypothetical protein